MMKRNNYFITVEGVEGVGKSTVIHKIKTYLAQLNVSCSFTREPGGTPIAEKIRDILLHDKQEIMDIKTELLLMFASRAQHIAQFIRPELEKGNWVVSDRFVEASYAYQGGGRGIPDAIIEQLASFVLDDIQPDHVILLDAPIELATARMKDRKEKDRIEQEQIAFFQRVREKYLSRAKSNSQKYTIVDASLPLREVEENVCLILDKLVATC